MRTITFVNQSTVVTKADAQAAVAALQTQVTRDFLPAWGITATLALGDANAHGEKIFILDTSDQAGALGYHKVDKFLSPVGFVFAKTTQDDGETWQSCASHELLEQLADPWVFSTVLALWRGNITLLALEVCDPVESDVYKIDGVEMSNFVLPNWFEKQGQSPVDFLRKLRAPLTLTSGGYQSWTRNLLNWQQTSAPEHSHIHGDFSRPTRRRMSHSNRI